MWISWRSARTSAGGWWRSTGAMVGLALLGSLVAALPLAAQQADSDGDGLPDSWEINGYDADGDGAIDVDLPALGANPLRKDIFVEIDWMQGATCNQKPSQAAIDAAIASFAVAPVSNPDGSTGISLHVDYGQGGSFTGGNSLVCSDVITWPSGFQTIKSANFNPARQAIFHYNIWGIQYSAGSGVTTSSGIAELPGDDFLVSLGAFPGGNGTQAQQAGTFMHEMGHNFGFLHGGSDNANYKPNHLSVMSYSFQLTGVLRDGSLGNFDYQRFAVDSLNERSLDETVGLTGSTELNRYGTVWFCTPTGSQETTPTAAGFIDWNCDEQAGTGVRTSINLNFLRTVLEATPNQWASLIYTGGNIGDGAAGSRPVIDNLRLRPASTSVDEPKADELLSVERSLRESVQRLRQP